MLPPPLPESDAPTTVTVLAVDASRSGLVRVSIALADGKRYTIVMARSRASVGSVEFAADAIAQLAAVSPFPR